MVNLHYPQTPQVTTTAPLEIMLKAETQQVRITALLELTLYSVISASTITLLDFTL